MKFPSECNFRLLSIPSPSLRYYDERHNSTHSAVLWPVEWSGVPLPSRNLCQKSEQEEEEQKRDGKWL